jgi:hypothetical protein
LCRDIEGDPNHVRKEHIVRYELLNPYKGDKEIEEAIRITNWFKKSNSTDEKDILTITSINCNIDGRTKIISKDRIGYEYETIENEYYTTKVFLMDKKDNTEGIKFHFKQFLKVEIRFSSKVIKDDPAFTKRIQHPAENFRLDYQYLNENIKLEGQIIGTYLKESDISITYESDNSISLETFNWLLPDNGAVVVVTKK